jgi:acetoin utilization deacetylase AcuC-like enzyme
MKVVVATHPSMLDHDTGPRHPERPARLEAAIRGVRRSGLEVIEVEAPLARRSELLMVHDPSYVDTLQAICRQGGGFLDFDTVVSERSWDAALRSAGAVLAVVEELGGATDSSITGLAMTRPPGHHALRDRAMGFCMFNNVAIGSAVLRSQGWRVAILDWDVHHGNGTQAILGEDEGVLYVSLHQSGFYPFEGYPEDIDLAAPGTSINFPFPKGTGGDVIRESWEGVVLPVVEAFQPDWVLVSAGYDAHHSDPLGELILVDEDYGWMGHRLAGLVPTNRVVLALEGGYDLDAVERSVSATLEGLSGVEPEGSPLPSPSASWDAAAAARAAVERHWRI